MKGDMEEDLEVRINSLLQRLGIPLKAVWLPSRDAKEHARIIVEEGLLMIYDKDPNEAWTSLIHELVEWRFRPVLKIYRNTINSLIALLEQVAYAEKEKAVESVVKDLSVWKEFELASAPTSQAQPRRSKKNG